MSFAHPSVWEVLNQLLAHNPARNATVDDKSKADQQSNRQCSSGIGCRGGEVPFHRQTDRRMGRGGQGGKLRHHIGGSPCHWAVMNFQAGEAAGVAWLVSSSQKTRRWRSET